LGYGDSDHTRAELLVFGDLNRRSSKYLVEKEWDRSGSVRSKIIKDKNLVFI
jgi:hypothetical protein